MKTEAGWQEEMAVVTPESVSFSYEVAGIGSRFLALLIDHFIELCCLVAVLVILGRLRLLNNEYALLLVSGGAFLFFMGYFIFFEIIWDGQSPGKRLLHLRVVRDGGYGLTALESVLRNLLRIIDFLPGAYGIGLLAMFMSAKSRRLGDFVAGTVVVRDQQTKAPVRQNVARSSILDVLVPEVQILIRGRLNTFHADELRVMRDFVKRRTELTAPARAALAAKLNSAILAHIPELGELMQSMPSERLLEAVVAAYEERLG